MNEDQRLSLTEMKNEKSSKLHQFSTRQIVELMNEQDKTVADTVANALPQIEKAVNLMIKHIESNGRVIYFGAGTSGRLGVLDASECPPTFGVSSELIQGIIAGGDKALRTAVEDAEDNEEAGKSDVKKNYNPKDIVVGITSSGSTPYVLGAMKQAKKMGIPTIGIACNTKTNLTELVDCPIELPVGPEIVTGSTRLKAGTAQKMVLNILSTATMIRTGKVYKNLMVNVQATNEKLRKRAINIIMDITNVEEEKAIKANDAAEGNVQVAILSLLYSIEPTQAQQTLLETNGNFIKAMEELEK